MKRISSILLAATALASPPAADFIKPSIDVTFDVEENLGIKGSIGDDLIADVARAMREMVPQRLPFLAASTQDSSPYVLQVFLDAKGESAVAKNLEFILDLKAPAGQEFSKFRQPRTLTREFLPGDMYEKFLQYDAEGKRAEILGAFWEKLDDSLIYWCFSCIPLAQEVYALPSDQIAMLPFGYEEIGARSSAVGEPVLTVFDLSKSTEGRVKRRLHCFVTPLEGEVDVTGLPEAEDYSDCIATINVNPDEVDVRVASSNTQGEAVEAKLSGVPLTDLFQSTQDGAVGYRAPVEGVFIMYFVPDQEPPPYPPESFVTG